MGKYRKRFNEKARSGMLAKQAALKKARNKQHARDSGETQPAPEPAAREVEDPNAEVLMPVTAEEMELRKRALQESLYAQNSESKMSRAKKKRLDKYIEHQLKREERKVLMEKLAGTHVNSALLVPSKLLGKGKRTRREDMVEALVLERQGRCNEHTRALLYKEREVKESEENSGASASDRNVETHGQRDPDESESDFDDAGSGHDTPKSNFVDFRPQKFGGAGAGFGFANVTRVEKTKPKKKYTWRLRLEQEEKKRGKLDDENDFVLSGALESASESPESDDGTSDGRSEDESDDDEDEGDADSDVDGEKNGVSDESDGENESESESDNKSESESNADVPRVLQNKPKHSKAAESFKEWAERVVRKLEGHSEMVLPELGEDIKQKYAKGVHADQVFSDDDIAVPVNSALQRMAVYVDVVRDESIQQQRMQLPVFSEEHRIMEAIHHHDCIVLCGETGSGKTTQVPQFLYEAGFGSVGPDGESGPHSGMIGVTQPRRVAAVSMAQRVARELGNHAHRVGYQIRFDSNIANEGQRDGTALKFMTDGVLLREMMVDFLLTKYSAVVIDEAHERNVNTDILIGMLSRVVRLRRARGTPIKLVVMSATLRVTDFAENAQLFPVLPPVVTVDARQFPVSVHFSKKTRFDYVDEAFRKVCKIHRRHPPGGILVFLTGQNEIIQIVKRLRAEFPFRAVNANYDVDAVEYRRSRQVAMEAEDVDLDIALRDKREQLDSESSDEDFDECFEPGQAANDPLYVLPLYSMLPTSQQMKVFESAPPGSRMCIVATNVAETSLTIPGIRYVVDCGRAKERRFDDSTGVQSFEVDWVSKASADQRTGRAGRTSPGHCYRLYSSAIYEEFFPQFSVPEILRMPAESTVLVMKSMGIDQIANFPFPTPPDRGALVRAERLLVTLGALDKEHKNITDLGRTMAHFPLSPRYAKILIVGNQLDCLPYVVALVSALSVGDPFLDEQEAGGDLERHRQLRIQYHRSRAVFARLDASCDAFRLLSVVCALDHVPPGRRAKFIRDHFLRAKTLDEIQKLRGQIRLIVLANVQAAQATALPAKTPLGVPSKPQLAALKQIVASGFVDQVAVRADVVDADVKLPKRAAIATVPYATNRPTAAYADDCDPHMYIHPSSLLCASGATPPSYLVYQVLNRPSNLQTAERGSRPVRLRMRPLVDLSARQLANIARGSLLLTYSKPLGHPYAPKQLSATRRECCVVPRYGAALGDGGLGWDLPPEKIIQVRKQGQWVVEQ
ncbi:P-loop containing nucleoside triphosphate hydrolase protein [Metschnikowia bicuspidata]|uniref:RNA helicase n=1 Tax=Metschnikowia bicuspidata TaxID=27322 RepID=A0A4P9ZBV7_9ASCO|nr:P-loop containing nucleoside triphosphate hydrolase protein [Metschnikowia bicuspidata]